MFNLIYANVFSNTNRTNLTNLFIYDSKMNIREISVQLNIYANAFSNTNRESNEY